jgi:hypothetical protein
MIYDVSSPLFQSFLVAGGAKSKKQDKDSAGSDPKPKAKDNKPAMDG